MAQLTEKYRPQTWDEVAGQPAALKAIAALRRNGLAGRALWITGQSGTGKTTIARLYAAEVAAPWSTIEIDGREVNAEFIRDIDRMTRTKPIGAPGWCIIINEAHGVRSTLIKSLNTLLEMPHIQANSTWLFTTTVDGNELFDMSSTDAAAFTSRCTRIALARRDLCKPFAQRIATIIEREFGVNKPMEVWERVLKSCGNNLRAGINQAETLALAD